MSYYEQRIRELEEERENRRFACKRCGSQRYEVVLLPNFRLSKSAYYVVECLSCGYTYEVTDLHSG